MRVNMREAKNQLSRLVQAAQDGEEIVIVKNGYPAARIVPFSERMGLTGWGRLKNVKGIDKAFDAKTGAEVARSLKHGK